MADDLVVSVGANIAALERQMKAAARSGERAAEDIESRFRKINPTISTSALTGALKGFAAAFTVDRIIRGLADANAELVRIGETAKRVGLDLQRFQELQFAGRQNGLSGKDFGSGIEGLAEKLNEARQKENELSQLFSDNNIKLKDRQGQVIGVNEALGKAAELVSNAATEFDKIKIAEALGLTRDWVPLLEQGAEAINRQASAARAAGVVIDSDIIQKAKDFERDWTAAIDRWATIFKANAGSIIGVIDTIIGKASQLFAGLDRYSKGIQAAADLNANGAAGANRATLDYARNEFAKTGEPLPKDLQQRIEQLNEFEREAARAKGAERGSAPLEVTVRKSRPTDTSSLYGGKKGGGGGSSKSEDDEAQARLERYIETLMRQNAVLDAEITTFGKSNAEKRAAVELAKAQVDLAKLDEASRQTIIASLTKEIELSEQKRTKLKELKDAQDALNEAQKFFGNAAVDALEDMIFNGAKAEDVIRNLTKSLAQAAIKALLLGEGPLAGLFGTKGADGALGGLFGAFGKSLFGKATGGGVNAGQAYRVGERGPETFVPTVPGRIIPAGRGGGGQSFAVAIDVRGATGNQEIQTMVRQGIAAGIQAYDRQLDRSLPGKLAVADARFG